MLEIHEWQSDGWRGISVFHSMNPGSSDESLLNKTIAVVRGEYPVRGTTCSSMKFVAEVKLQFVSVLLSGL
jgi:hypothetical protein